jgi:hypothetical protein
MSLQLNIEKAYSDTQHFIECHCKIKFRGTFQFVSLKLNRNETRNPSRSLKSLVNFSQFEEVNERDRFLIACNENVEFGLGTPLERNELLQIDVYRARSFRKK